jgi:LPXTG-motif cell wall-anchored protein
VSATDGGLNAAQVVTWAGSAVLPNTGSNVESNLELAAAMVATGAFGLLLVRRRRRTTT